ncbi:MAG: hypothetical protein GY870_05065, partial [archaeon]|nr:hypothetical protein [archaeon]
MTLCLQKARKIRKEKMKYKDFQIITLKIWNSYFEHLYQCIQNGQITFDEQANQKNLFPNTVIFTETNKHFIAEFFGAEEKYCGLTTKQNKEDSSEKYFYQFTLSEKRDKKAFIIMNGKSVIFNGMRISMNFNEEKVKKRFPHFKFSDFDTYDMKSDLEIPFLFGESFGYCLMSDFLLINTKDDFYRFKYIINLAMINKSISTYEYRDYLKEQLGLSLNKKPFRPYGLVVCEDKDAEKRILSSQFANIYLSNFGETKVGNFLFKHPEIINKGLNCDDFLYEKGKYSGSAFISQFFNILLNFLSRGYTHISLMGTLIFPGGPSFPRPLV